ncbi:hypothetical protein SUGI_0726660 [Cryptomeria japonica]|nr:hypothetical protein SUGI_0726660 [Cryptomeria japonica]
MSPAQEISPLRVIREYCQSNPSRDRKELAMCRTASPLQNAERKACRGVKKSTECSRWACAPSGRGNGGPFRRIS